MKLKKIIMVILLLLSLCFVVSCELNIKNPHYQDNTTDNNDAGNKDQKEEENNKNEDSLAELKKDKLADIDDLALNYKETDYKSNEWLEITKLIQGAKDTINNYTTKEDVNNYTVASLKESLDNVKTSIEIDAESFTTAKANRLEEIDDLKSQYNEADYNINEWLDIENLIVTTKNTINSFTTIEQINEYSLDSLKNSLAAIKTKKEIELEEINEIKLEIISDIDNLALEYKQIDYRANEWDELTALIQNDKVLVNSYTTLAQLNDYSLASLRTSLDLIKTDAELTEEENKIQQEDLAFHFLELGNYNAGDCTFIKAGDVDILIDAGSDFNSIPIITSYINNYCTDGVLEYVIATHAHLDHIAGFAPYSGTDGIFELYECEVIIDFALKNTDSQVSQRYVERRDKEIELGAKHYTAADCINQTNGGKPIFEITETITMEILDQKFYHQSSSDENNYSVCTLFTQGDNNYLLTGDLEQEGEESLVAKNDLPHCVLFKGGHHGSKTSSNDCLLNEITPDICCVCCCAGTNEYTNITDNQFPTQEFINRIAKHTDKVYVTSTCEYEIAVATSATKGVEVGDEYLKSNSNKYKSLNGNIVVSTKNGIVSVNCSNNNTKLKDSEWFNTEFTLNQITRKMRTWPGYGVVS